MSGTVQVQTSSQENLVRLEGCRLQVKTKNIYGNMNKGAYGEVLSQEWINNPTVGM